MVTTCQPHCLPDSSLLRFIPRFFAIITGRGSGSQKNHTLSSRPEGVATSNPPEPPKLPSRDQRLVKTPFTRLTAGHHSYTKSPENLMHAVKKGQSKVL